MKIIVLVKQVPNTTEVKLDPKTGNLIREGIESIINPDDRHALEAAVHLKESAKAKVTVLSMGPPQAIDAVSEAMGMGADEGILLTDRAFAGADTWRRRQPSARPLKPSAPLTWSCAVARPLTGTRHRSVPRSPTISRCRR